MPLGALHTPQSSDSKKEPEKPTRVPQALNSYHLDIYLHNLESSWTKIRGNAKTFPGGLACPLKVKVPHMISMSPRRHCPGKVRLPRSLLVSIAICVHEQRRGLWRFTLNLIFLGLFHDLLGVSTTFLSGAHSGHTLYATGIRCSGMSTSNTSFPPFWGTGSSNHLGFETTVKYFCRRLVRTA